MVQCKLQVNRRLEVTEIIEDSGYTKEDLYRTYDRVNQWITNCDTKASIVIAGLGVGMALLLSKDYILKYKAVITKFMTPVTPNSSFLMCLLFVAVAMIGCGCYSIYKVLVPNVDPKVYQQAGLTTKSLLFFSTIAAHNDFDVFRQNVRGANTDEFISDLKSQIFMCSKICDIKFKSYNRGLKLICVGVVVFSIVISIGMLFY